MTRNYRPIFTPFKIQYEVYVKLFKTSKILFNNSHHHHKKTLILR